MVYLLFLLGLTIAAVNPGASCCDVETNFYAGGWSVCYIAAAACNRGFGASRATEYRQSTFVMLMSFLYFGRSKKNYGQASGRITETGQRQAVDVVRNCSTFFQSQPMRIFPLYIMLLIMASCGYMDDDGIDFEEQIVGKFYIQQHARSNEIALSYVENLEFSTVIIADCNRLSYDSTKREIFVEELLWDSATSYHLIKIIDANAEESLGAFKKKEVFEKTFFTKLDTCKYCQVWDMTVKRKADKIKSPS